MLTSLSTLVVVDVVLIDALEDDKFLIFVATAAVPFLFLFFAFLLLLRCAVVDDDFLALDFVTATATCCFAVLASSSLFLPSLLLISLFGKQEVV